jgi:hypothetical protein
VKILYLRSSVVFITYSILWRFITHFFHVHALTKQVPILVLARFKVLSISDYCNIRILSFNPTQDKNECPCFSVFMSSCVGRSLAMKQFHSQGVLISRPRGQKCSCWWILFVKAEENHESEQHTLTTLKSSVFWDIRSPCSPVEVSRCFGGTCRLRF